MLKILFARTFGPTKIVSGADMRAAPYVDYFRQRGRVDLLTLTAPNDRTDADYIRSHFDKHHYFDQQDRPRRLGRFEKAFSLAPWQITKYYSPEFQKKLERTLEDGQYDLIFVFKLEPVLFFLRLPPRWRKRVVVDFDDILSDLYRDHYRDILTSLKNSHSLRHYEFKAFKEFKRVFVCSPDAASTFPAKNRERIGVIPNIFPPNSGRFIPSPGPVNRILFIGSLNYFPNTEGLRWFCARVWPEFLKAYPDCTLSVVGKQHKKSVDNRSMIGDPPRTDLAVNVPSVAPYYSECGITIVPLLNGSGTRLKILEAAAYGRPVITTAKGMEGLDFEDGKDIFVFKDAPTFINAYQALLNQKKYAQTSRNAHHVLKTRYSPDVFTVNMDKNWPLMVN